MSAIPRAAISSGFQSYQSQQYVAINRAVKFFAATIVAGAAAANLLIAHGLYGYAEFLHDMLGNKPLPPITGFAVAYPSVFICTSLIIPLAAILFCAKAGVERTLYFCGTATAVLVFQAVTVAFALLTPLTSTMQGMNGPG